MSRLFNTIVKIVKSKAGIIPAFWCDPNSIFADVIQEKTDEIGIFHLATRSNIGLQSLLKNINILKPSVIYTRHDIPIDAYIASKKLSNLEITPHTLLSNFENLNSKIEGKLELTDKQFSLFISNFDFIVDCLKNSESITNEKIKEYMAQVFLGAYITPREMLISFLKGELNIENAKSLYLFDKIVNTIKGSFGIDISEIKDNKDLSEKVFVTLLKNEDENNFKTEYTDKLINIKVETLNKMWCFITQNSTAFSYEIAAINKKFEGYLTNKIIYLIPQLFTNFILKNLREYKTLQFDESKLWTEETVRIASFILMLKEINDLLLQYVGYSFPNNTMNDIINEYKQKLYKIDNLFRNISVCVSEFTFDKDIYKAIIESGVISEIREKYFNVLSNVNGKYISSYKNLCSNPNGAVSQFDFIKSHKFREQTLFIFADGLRYELAKDIVCVFDDVTDINVYSLLPTETEVCMNGYFITDEKVRMNDRRVFELVKEGKIITQINSWRIEKLSQILKTNVISFNEFKQSHTYNNSVICFYNDVDYSIHNLDDVPRVSTAASEIKNLIKYAKIRGFDVCLLSDHGFIEVKEKITSQNKTIEADKKKGRYILLSPGESVDKMFYSDDFPLPSFLDMQGRGLCFINSVNTLKSTSNYTHGGISLQENIITAFVIKSPILEIKTTEKHIQNVVAFNEIIADISNAAGSECSVYFGAKKIFVTIIDEPIYKLRVPIRNYNKNDEFLIVLTLDIETEKFIIKKTGNTVVDEDLDIF